MSFDEKCLELAEHFLADHPELREFRDELAAEIQQAIEIWLEEMLAK